jgi:hypothetical protein
MAASAFDEFLNTLDFGDITGPTEEEDMRDALEQRDRFMFLATLFASGAVEMLDGSTRAEQQAWRESAHFVLHEVEQRHHGPAAGKRGEPVFSLTGPQAYVVLVKSICAAYRAIDVAAVHIAADAVLEMYASEIKSEEGAAWRADLEPLPLCEREMVRLMLQASYVYSHLHPDAILQ